MRKNLICILILLVILVPFGVLFTSCSDYIREYKGTPINKIVYENTDGWGMGSVKTIDFTSKTIAKREVNSGMESSETILAEFNDDDGKYIVDALYTYGLYKLKEQYPNNGVFHDGGSWRLTICYEDGSEKISYGGVNYPDKVFTKSAIAIYDKTQVEFFVVPQEYKEPPRVDVELVSHYTDGFNQSGMSIGSGTMYKYNWHTTTLDNGDLYQFASTLHKSDDAFKYTGEGASNYMIIATTNSYRYYNSDYKEKFKRCVVKEYDNNPELTNETVLLDCGWIKSGEGERVNIQQNKIYTVELTFKNDWYSIVVVVT